jgi:hypothetical protein
MIYEKRSILTRNLQLLLQHDQESGVFTIHTSTLKARTVPNPGDVPPLRLQ